MHSEDHVEQMCEYDLEQLQESADEIETPFELCIRVKRLNR